MAQPAVATVSGVGSTPVKSFSKDAFEIQQYQKIVQFQKAIEDGKRPPGITLPAPSGPAEADARRPPFVNEKEPVIAPKSGVGNRKVSKQGASSGPVRINPILLEKSDQLIKAELQLQRQRLEQALKEEAEQRRLDKILQFEPALDLDLSGVLAKALTLAEVPVPRRADGGAKNAHSDGNTDSLDESTFYSSRHDTPESHLTSLIRTQSNDGQATDLQPDLGQSSQQANRPNPPPPSNPGDNLKVASVAFLPSALGPPDTTASSSNPQISIVPGLNNYVQTQTPSSAPARATKDGNTNRPTNAPPMDAPAVHPEVPSTTGQSNKDVQEISRFPSPLVRNHALRPVAPQSTNPSSIRTLAATSPFVQQMASVAEHRGVIGTSAQVAALRVEHNATSSPDSSSQNGKKKGKKKKRKADRHAADVASMYIKTEPHSPSPLDGGTHIRPSKRQRQEKNPATGHGFEPQSQSAAVPRAGAQYFARPEAEDGRLVGYATASGHPQQPYSSTTVSHVRYSSDGQYYTEPWVRAEEPVQRQGQGYATEAASYQARYAPARRSVSQAMITESYPAGSRPYREYHEGPRMVTHAEVDTFMAPRRPVAARILLDAFGREYIEPPHHSPSHLSAISPSRHGEHEVMYERVPAPTFARHPAPAPYAEDSVAYAAPSPARPMSRRVVTQPQYASYDYRDARPGENLARPLSTQGEFVQLLTPQERRYGDDNYGMRSASVRPADSLQYQMPPPDFARVHSVRPEALAPTDHRASIHPEGRREALQPYMMEYRPVQAQEPVFQRGPSVRPANHPLNDRSRGAGDLTFVERSGGAPAQEIVYAADGRGEVYR